MSRRVRLLLCAASLALSFALYIGLVEQRVALTFDSAALVLARPAWLALLGLLPLLAASQDRFTSQAVARSLWLRALVLATLSGALARPLWQGAQHQVRLAIAIDASDSIAAEAAQRAHAFALRLREQAGGRATQFEFAATAQRPAAPNQDWARTTDLQAALRHAYGLSRPDFPMRVVLVSDGRQTAGDLLAEAEVAARLDIELDYLLLDSKVPDEVAVRALTAPPRIEVSRPFTLRASLFSSAPRAVEVRLYQDAQTKPIAQRSLQLQALETHVDFPLTVHVPGALKYRLELSTHDPDRLADNNRAQIPLWVDGPPNLLLIATEPQRLQPIAQALRAQGFDVQLRSPIGLPQTATEFAAFDLVLLSDLPATALPAATLSLLDHYTHDSGAGLLIAGGSHSFGPGGYAGTRLERWLPVRLAGETRLEEPSLALALLIDCSGSMAGTKLELAKDASAAAVSVLADADLIEVIGFAAEPARSVRMQNARNRSTVVQSIARLAAQGGTQLLPALDVAYQDLAATRARIKHVIVLTDGQTDEVGFDELIQAMRSEGITLSTVGLGRDVNRQLLQDAASAGAGRAYFTDDPHSVPRIFIHETTAQKQNSTPERATRLHAREPTAALRGVDLEHAPLLLGYVVTQPKPAPAQVLLAADDGSPLLARTRYGLGYVLAFTSDLEARWSADLLRWREFGPLLAQVVREHMRQPPASGFPLRAELRAGTLRATLDAIDAAGHFVSDLTPQLEVVDRPGTIAMQETGPGRYETELSLPDYGTFTLLAHQDRGRASTAIVSNAYPDEYLPGAPNKTLLARAATLTAGRELDARTLTTALRPARRPIPTQTDLTAYASWLAFLTFALELTLRRLQPFKRRTA